MAPPPRAPGTGFRPTMHTTGRRHVPTSANRRAMERPNPVPPPVIKIVRPLSKSFWNIAASEPLRILDASLLVSQGHSRRIINMLHEILWSKGSPDKQD